MNRAQFSPKGTYLLAIGSDPVSKISEGLLWNLSATASDRQPAILQHDEAITIRNVQRRRKLHPDRKQGRQGEALDVGGEYRSLPIAFSRQARLPMTRTRPT